MRSLVTLAGLAALAALAALADGARADPRTDPLARVLEGPPHPLAALLGPVLVCTEPAPSTLPWCPPEGIIVQTTPPTTPPQPAKPAVPGNVSIASKQAHDPSTLKADQV